MQGRGLKLMQLQSRGAGAVSPLMQGRGLKPTSPYPLRSMLHVAPHAGAWIETRSGATRSQQGLVAPHAGAWIETISRFSSLTCPWMSPLMQGRGLKRGSSGGTPHAGRVAPHAGAWIETARGCRRHKQTPESPLMQGRGLKRYEVRARSLAEVSPLMQGRGLKLMTSAIRESVLTSPLMQGRGLKHHAARG